MRSVKHLRITANPLGNIEDKSISFAERVLKKLKLQSHASTSEYMDMRFLTPTTFNICERLFSKAGFTMTDRKGPFCLSMRRPRCFCILTWICGTLIPFARLLQKTQNKYQLLTSIVCFLNHSTMIYCLKMQFTINIQLYCRNHWCVD